MIELRADGSIPGKPVFARIYKIVDLMTGAIGYNYTNGERTEDMDFARIEAYDTFQGWETEIISATKARELIKELNSKKEFIETPHTKLVSSVRERVSTGDVSDPAAMLAEMRAMYIDIMGARVRPPLPGWK